MDVFLHRVGTLFGFVDVFIVVAAVIVGFAIALVMAASAFSSFLSCCKNWCHVFFRVSKTKCHIVHK